MSRVTCAVIVTVWFMVRYSQYMLMETEAGLDCFECV
jgi:hypothetical protein